MTETQRKGKLEGFYIKYQAVSRGGEPVLDLMAESNYTAMVCMDLNEVVITNLTSYTTYKIEVAVRTTEGIGNFSEPVYGGIS